MTKDVLIGVDIGGTTVKIALISTKGEMITKWEIPTILSNAGENVPRHIWNAIKEKLQDLKISKDRCIGMGVGAPGFIEPETGSIAIAVNIGWRNFPLKDILEELSELPVFIDNDANIAALGENWKGSGNQVHNMLAVTLGTGVGGGIISNRKIISGANGTGGEIGHITVVQENGAPCNCGRSGCLETVASATGIVRQAKEWINLGKAPLLEAKWKENGELTTKDIFEAVASGDQPAKQLIDQIMDVLGFSLANIAVTTNPAKIVIGGGVSKAGNVLLDPLIEAFRRYALPRISEACEIVIAQLGNDAGVYGGAYLVLQNQGN
ncbi:MULTISPECIES: ROK family glucokinase [Gracilibacillus]|uniref:Glucokinase n=1 Tax=Gracilibacillus dipsosauri TaxID=178340 RepID=A0A317KYC3_9BACI|nr:ROK family glucokinase [Gracilibacillus dipsosauri]PWU68521.1 glucokinase [Gracilibacillus dipsosauri]